MQINRLRWREFVTLVGGVAVVWPLTAEALGVTIPPQLYIFADVCCRWLGRAMFPTRNLRFAERTRMRPIVSHITISARHIYSTMSETFGDA